MFKQRSSTPAPGPDRPAEAGDADEGREILATLRRSVLDQELTRQSSRQRGWGLDW